MGREILFRGKNPDNGKWYEGVYSPYNWDFFGMRSETPQIIIASDDSYMDGKWIEVIPETVGQFTGLTDNNGERIWEGDIVRCKQERNNEGICVVREFNGAFVACPITGNLLELTLYSYWYNDYDLVEVIGNETDNPELLKGE